MVVDLRHVVFFSFFATKMWKSENTKIQQSKTLPYFCVFPFSRGKIERQQNLAKIQHIKCILFSPLICRIFAFFCSLFHIVVFFAFAHLCFFAFLCFHFLASSYYGYACADLFHICHMPCRTHMKKWTVMYSNFTSNSEQTWRNL